MKNLIFNACIMILIISFTASCENETAENTNPDTFLQQDASKQLVSIKNVAPEEAAKLAETFKELKKLSALSSRIGCTLNSDIGCGGDAIAEIEEYVNQSGCISYPVGNLIYPIQAVQYTYNYSYYVDSDDDINMDQYQFQFDSHVGDIQNRIAPKKITFIDADASNTCGVGVGYKVSSVTYTVILGN